jgi:hypothetical protein
MSHVTPFTFGLGGGLALWHLLKPPAIPEAPALRNSSRGFCALQLDALGLTIDGAPVELDEAVRRSQSAGSALIAVAPDAPASTYAVLTNALREVGVPIYARTVVAAARNAADTRTDFTLIVYAQGHTAGATSRWFRAETPITWIEARARLIAAGVIEARLAGRTHEPGGWMLSIDPAQFYATKAEPLPGAPRNAEAFSAFTLVTYPDGVGGANKIMRWFRTDAPMTWQTARDQLARAGIIDPTAIAPSNPGYWKLVTDSRVFMPSRAKPLPGRRARNSYISQTFTLTTYPEGVGGPRKVRWFLAKAPIRWDDARDRLAAAGILDEGATKASDPGYWILVSAPHAFKESQAEPLPPRRKPRDAARTGRYGLDGGRTIVRDGEALVRLERVDLGDERYALTPHETDQLGAQIVRLLNKRGGR